MRNEFVFCLPTRIEFGNGSIDQTGLIAKELGAKKVIVITDKGLSRTEILERLRHSLSEAKIEVVLYDDVRANPRDTEAQRAADFARSEQVDAVIACGGGSSMDLAKAVAALLTNEGEIRSIMKPNEVPNKPAPLICVPTTAGTGSEVTSFAVLTIEEESRKSSIFDDKIRPDVAIEDPSVLQHLPPPVAASTGMDALTHAIEAYTCKLATPLTDGLALQAIRYIAESLPEFIHVRSEESCRKMMAGSLMAGIAFGFSDIAGVHCMAEALGGMYDTPHGVANAIFLPIVFEYNMETDLKRHRDVAVALGISPVGKRDEEIAAEAVIWMRSISREMKIPTLQELGYVSVQKFDELAELCMKNVSLSSNCRELGKTDFVDLYKRAYNLG